MKVFLEQSDFLRALNVATRSLMLKANLPILSNVLLRSSGKKLEIITTNLETACRVEVEAKVEREGGITVVGRALVEFISQLVGGTISVEKLGEELLISSGDFNARLSTMGPEEFPAIPKIVGGKRIELKPVDLINCVGKVAFCAAVDESRPILTGVLCQLSKKGLTLVATDGFRLGHAHIEVTAGADIGGVSFIIPSKAFSEVAKIVEEQKSVEGKEANVILLLSDDLNQAVFEVGRVEFTTRLIEGTYPAWDKLIPSNFSTSAKINKEELVRVIKIASIFARDSGNIIRMKLGVEGKAQFLTVSANTAQVGSSDSKIPFNLKGRGGEIAFNFRYLLEVLSVIDGEEVGFEMNESLNPGKITAASGSASFFHIIMPVRLQN